VETASCCETGLSWKARIGSSIAALFADYFLAELTSVSNLIFLGLQGIGIELFSDLEGHEMEEINARILPWSGEVDRSCSGYLRPAAGKSGKYRSGSEAVA